MDRWRQVLLLGRLIVWCALFWFILDGLPYIAAWRQRLSAPPARTPAPAGFAVSLTLQPSSIRAGQPATLCYQVTGAAAFTLDPHPPEFAGASKGCLPVSPQASTRYTLSATDALQSKLSKSVLLTVEPAAR